MVFTRKLLLGCFPQGTLWIDSLFSLHADKDTRDRDMIRLSHIMQDLPMDKWELKTKTEPFLAAQDGLPKKCPFWPPFIFLFLICHNRESLSFFSFLPFWWSSSFKSLLLLLIFHNRFTAPLKAGFHSRHSSC